MVCNICYLATPEIVDQGESDGSHLWVPLYWDRDENAEKCFKASCTSPGLPLMSKWFATTVRGSNSSVQNLIACTHTEATYCAKKKKEKQQHIMYAGHTDCNTLPQLYNATKNLVCLNLRLS